MGSWIRGAVVAGAGIALLIGFAHQTAAQLPVTADLVMHLDASAIDTGDTDQVTWNGGTGYIKKWADQSGVGNDALEVTFGEDPWYVTGADAGEFSNFKPVVRFAGSDYLQLTSVPELVNIPKGTVFIVLSMTEVTDNHTAICAYVGGQTAFPRIQKTDKYLTGGYLTCYGWAPHTLQANVLEVIASGYDGTEAIATNRLTMSIDNVPQALTDWYNLPSVNNGAVNGMMVGAYYTGAYEWSGDIAEIAIYTNLLTAAQQKEVIYYLGNKYGVEVGAPAVGTVVFIR